MSWEGPRLQSCHAGSRMEQASGPGGLLLRKPQAALNVACAMTQLASQNPPIPSTSNATLGWSRLPTRLSVVEHTANGTLVGAVPASSTTNLLAYTIVSGNTGSTFSVDATGAVSVASNTL